MEIPMSSQLPANPSAYIGNSFSLYSFVPMNIYSVVNPVFYIFIIKKKNKIFRMLQ